MKFFLIAMLLLLSPRGILAQNVFITYYESSTYGVIDSNGKEVIPCLYESYPSRLSKARVAVKNEDESWSIVDTMGGVTKLAYEYERQLSDELLCLKNNKEYLVCGLDGVPRWSTRFRFCTLFNSHGLATVEYGVGSKKALINTKGELVVEAIYDEIMTFNDDVACVSNNGKHGCINTKGELIVPMIYDHAENYGHGLVFVKIGEKCGLVNTKDKVIIPIKYDDLRYVFETLGKVIYACKGDKYGYFDKRGRAITPFVYDNVSNISREGYLSVQKGRKWGAINTRGVEVIPCIYDKSLYFVNGFSKARLNKKHGIIDTKGNVVVPFIYERILNFSQGLVGVCLDEKWGFVNTRSELVVEHVYDECSGFENGLAVVYSMGKCGAIDTAGKVVIPLIYSEIEHIHTSTLLRARKASKWGLIDKTGREVVPIIYTQITGFEDGLAVVKK